MTTTDAKQITEKVYHTKNGGQIIARGPIAIANLNQHKSDLEKQVTVANDSTLIFERTLPQDTVITGNSQVYLGSDAQLEHVGIDNSRIEMVTGRIKNSQLTETEYTPSDEPTADNLIENYDIDHAKIGGKTQLINHEAKHHLCKDIRAYDIQARSANLEGGLYTNCQISHSLLKQPSTTWFADSKFRHVAIVHPDAAKMTDFSKEARDFVEHSELENSAIFNNKLVDLCVSHCHIANMVSINGLLAENSTIIGPSDKIILDNIDTTKNQLNFVASPNSVTVRGLKLWRSLPPHYTSLKENQNFATNDVHFSTRFHDAILPATLLKRLDHLADLNTADDQIPIRDLNKALQSALDQKATSKQQTDSLTLE